MAAEAEAAFAWLRRQRDDPRQSTEVRVRSAEAGMLEVRCGKDVRLQLSVPHRDKLHELYCRTVGSLTPLYRISLHFPVSPCISPISCTSSTAAP